MAPVLTAPGARAGTEREPRGRSAASRTALLEEEEPGRAGGGRSAALVLRGVADGDRGAGHGAARARPAALTVRSGPTTTRARRVLLASLASGRRSRRRPGRGRSSCRASVPPGMVSAVEAALAAPRRELGDRARGEEGVGRVEGPVGGEVEGRGRGGSGAGALVPRGVGDVDDEAGAGRGGSGEGAHHQVGPDGDERPSWCCWLRWSRPRDRRRPLGRRGSRCLPAGREEG